MPNRRPLSRARAFHRPRLAVALEYTLIAGGFALDVLETAGRVWRGFCEDGQRAVDDGCAEYEAREEWVMRDAA